jgi:hypothetical protein
MKSAKFSTLGTLAQQRAALPQLICRKGALLNELAALEQPRVQPSISETALHNSNDANSIASLLRMLSLAGMLALGGCAGFTVPMSDMELRAEAENCAGSALCRLLIEDKPTVLTLAVNDARLCETNARVAERILQREGVETRRFVVRLKAPRHGDFKTEGAQTQLLHTFVAASINRKWYAVDNGALPFCDRICRLDEALHGVQWVSGDTKPRVSVGEATIAVR